ncbi:vitellogenin 3, phosvitinless [Coregonus clupeaformis]|uniref:vitellogenin 3, phosvitinless n=1 Tax=Coregonus clupeaformis TaxID=59861 RepID=UPI001E1C2AF4|nr:vitellogenin 3, phosvitinless [Coregonus clupeaformis]XP_045061247.1 vitellogenin 3, phosvitinless [Coregonus clupeaformis]
MWGFVLCLLVALAACNNISYEPGLNPKKTYEYKYEGMVTIGRGMPNLAESGVRLMCKVKIIGVSAQTYLLQVSNLNFEEFNGIPGKNAFDASPKLTKRIAAELSKPFMFEYAKARVGDIRTSAEISDTIVNIVRGILGFFQVTVKTTQRVYELEEFGIHGLCQSTYAIEEDANSQELSVTQIVDINNCKEKAAIYRGMALAVDDKLSKERGDSVISTVRYVYTVKPTVDGGLIKKAHALEHQHFSPFNVKGGNSKLQAMKELVLLSVTDTVVTPAVGPVISRGNLVYKFVKVLAQIPILIKKLDDPVPKIAEMIKRLAQANIYQTDSATSEDVVVLFQLLRVTSLEDHEVLWKQLSGNDEHRRWFLDTIVEVADARVLKFLKNRFKAGDVSANEAGQMLLIAFNHVATETDLMEMAKEFLSMPFSKSHPMLWNTVVLSYGSLVYKYCAYEYGQPCPVAVVQPLLDLVTDGLKRNSELDMVLALKAIGNAGHPSSIKTIMRFLPGVSAAPVTLPARVLSAAVQSLRHLAVREPHSVQDITVSLFVQRHLPTEIRMLACMILFETKPPLALVSTVTAFLLEEADMHVASFSYSLIWSIAKSSTPDNHFLSTACNVAVKILAPKFGRISYHYSKAMHLDWFNDDFLIGTATEIFMLKNAASYIPTEIVTKGKFHFIGKILQLVELGFRAEGIKELFRQNIQVFNGHLSYTDFEAIFKVLQDWLTLPEDKPLLSAYTRIFGQEFFFVDLNKDLIQSVIKTVSPSAGKESPVWKMIEHLQKGMSWHWTKPFLMFETRYIQATSLGLPLEISKYYNTVTTITVNAKAAISPPLTDRLGQLLTSDVSLVTDGFAGFSKDQFVFHGINTDIFQCGAELKSKTVVAMPWEFSMKMNIKQNTFELDLPPCKKETKLFSVKFDVYAVSRNIEEPSFAKMTPMMPDSIESNEDIEPPKQRHLTSGRKIVKFDIYHPQVKVCAEANIYGAAFCVESEATRSHYIEEYPLYYLLGYTNFAYTIKPVQSNKPVDRIHIEMNASPTKYPVSVRQLLDTLRRHSKDATKHFDLSSDSSSSRMSRHASFKAKEASASEAWNATPEPLFTIKALAMSGNTKPEGYEAAAYYTPAAQMDNTQLIVSQVGEEANWKLCTDANVDKVRQEELKMHLRWGAECQSYEMSMRTATAHLPGSKPTLKAKIHWKTVSVYMTEVGKSIEKYIPGMAFLLGFYQKHDTNAKHEVSASVVAATADSIAMTIKLPELTVYHQAIAIPIQVTDFEDGQQYMGNSTLGMHREL